MNWEDTNGSLLLKLDGPDWQEPFGIAIKLPILIITFLGTTNGGQPHHKIFIWVYNLSVGCNNEWTHLHWISLDGLNWLVTVWSRNNIAGPTNWKKNYWSSLLFSNLCSYIKYKLFARTKSTFTCTKTVFTKNMFVDVSTTCQIQD